MNIARIYVLEINKQINKKETRRDGKGEKKINRYCLVGYEWNEESLSSTMSIDQ